MNEQNTKKSFAKSVALDIFLGHTAYLAIVGGSIMTIVGVSTLLVWPEELWPKVILGAGIALFLGALAGLAALYRK